MVVVCRFVLRLLGFVACCLPLHAADAVAPSPRLTGTPLMQVWHTEDFGASPLNWRVLQHPNGFIYVGNNFGVLEYDGAAWRIIPMPREGAARSLAVDPTGRVWAAGNGEIALLLPDAAGALRAVDQTERLPAGDRVFGAINRALAAPEGMYLSGDRRIFLFRADGLTRVWRTEGTFGPIWASEGAVYVARDLRDLVRLTPDGGAEVIESFSDPEAPQLRALAATEQGERVLLTRNGPMRWPAGAPPAPWSAGSSAVFRGDPARAGLRRADGRVAFGSVRGAVVLGRSGEVEQRFDISHGLPVDTINGLAEDREGGLWLATQNGVVRLQLDSPFATHGVAQGLDAGPRRLVRWRDRLYVAHGSGVAWRDASAGRFHPIAGLRTGANRPIVVDDRLLVSSGTGIKEIAVDDNVQTWSRSVGIALIASRRAPGWLLHGDSDGLSLLAPTPGANGAAGGWRVEGRLRNLPTNVVQIYDSGDDFVWIVGSQSEIWRVDFRHGLRLDAPCEQFDAERGVPPGRRRDHVQVFSLGDELVATGKAWTLHFDAARQRFTPATGFGLTRGIDAFDVVDAQTVWLHQDEPESRLIRLVRASPAAAGSETIFPAGDFEGLILNSIYHDQPSRTVWIAGQGTLVSMDLDWQRSRPLPPLTALLRRVTTSGGQSLLAGDDQPAAAHRLTAEQNALRFEFAAPTFIADYQGRIRTQYRTWIDGLDRDWTNWTGESYRDVTNLPFRDFTFRVQARTPDGRVSAERRHVFSIAPPWWLTRWAFGGYALLAAGGVTGLVRLRTRAQRRRADRLETVVLARTAEIAEKNSTLAAQNTELTRLRRLDVEEKIVARLGEEKARLEVLRYQLNPHFLFNALTSVCAQLPPAPGGARTTIERLTDFCQLTLFRPEGDEHPTLGDELKMLRAYLDIEQTRWGELLAVEIECAERLQPVRLPPLLLLPLVENALKYGRATNQGAMTIRVAARTEKWSRVAPGANGAHDAAGAPRPHTGFALVLEVANTGAWVESPGHRGVPSLGIGLENLQQRLRRYYPDAHAFTTESRDGWVVATVRIADLGGCDNRTTAEAGQLVI